MPNNSEFVEVFPCLTLRIFVKLAQPMAIYPSIPTQLW